MNKFISKTSEYLKYVFVDEYSLPNYSKLDISNTGQITYSFVSNGIVLSDHKKPTSIIKYLTLFMLYDSYLENKYGYLNVPNYVSRFKKLPEDTIITQIEKEFYCVLLVLRNAIIHHLGLLEESNDRTSVEYQYDKSTFAIDINFKSLKLITSFVAHRLEEKVINTHYTERFLKDYYKSTFMGINRLIYRNNKRKILNYKKWNFPLNRNYIIISENADIERVATILRECDLFNKTDYVLITQDAQYIIPSCEYQGIDKMLLVETPYFA